MSTRESGSSTQSTGTSWMRSPARSAITSNSVSKNQPVSATSGSSCRATSARTALNPHCASEKLRRACCAGSGCNCERRIRASARAPPARRAPAANRSRRRSGPKSTARQAASAPSGRSTGRRPCRRRRGVRGRSRRCAARRPRPFASRWITSTSDSSAASSCATARVRVGAGVVGDRDARRVGHLGGQELRAAGARCPEVVLLVVDGDHDIEDAACESGRSDRPRAVRGSRQVGHVVDESAQAATLLRPTGSCWG